MASLLIPGRNGRPTRLMRAAGSGCVLRVPRMSRSAKASPRWPRSAAGSSGCPPGSPTWRSRSAHESSVDVKLHIDLTAADGRRILAELAPRRPGEASSRDSIQQAIPNGFPKMPRLGRQKVVSASPRTDALNSGSVTIHRRPACGAGADQDDTGSDGVVDPDIRMALPDATLTREADDLDPVRVRSHRIFLELGKLAGRLVDRITRHAVGQLTDR